MDESSFLLGFPYVGTAGRPCAPRRHLSLALLTAHFCRTFPLSPPNLLSLLSGRPPRSFLSQRPSVSHLFK